VIFVHGFNGTADTYADLEREVAAAGFVVAAPDFPLSSSAYPGAAVRDFVQQATDVSFVVAALRDPVSVPVALAGTIADTPVGVIGHSDGGVTAAGVAYNSEYADPAIGAAVVLSGSAFGFPGTWFTGATPPLLAIHGDADEVNPYSSSVGLYNQAVGPKMLVTVLGGSHLGPFTTDSVRPLISAVIADFLHANLEHDAAAGDRIAGDACVPGQLAIAAAT
jgi:fermentation-respiration switch protein FrsA (DUF1100 family)